MKKRNEVVDFGGFITMLEVGSFIFTDINKENETKKDNKTA